MRKNVIHVLRLAMVATIAVAAAQAAHADDIKTTITAADAAWSAALAKGDARAIAALYTADGQILASGGDPVTGTAALTTLLQGIVDSGVGSATLTTLEVFGQGRYATSVGSYVMKDKAGKELDHGKYVELWRLDKGVWRLHRDIFNTSVPPKK